MRGNICRCDFVGAVGFQGLRHFNILSDKLPPPQPPDPPQVRLTREQLLPPTPSVYLEHKKDAFSVQLQEFCLQHPIAVVRGMASALKMGTCLLIPPISFSLRVYILNGFCFCWRRSRIVFHQDTSRSQCRSPSGSADATTTAS